MKKASAARIQSGYYEGYANGFKEGYSKAVMEFQEILLKVSSPKIIVTTQENVERLKREYNID